MMRLTTIDNLYLNQQQQDFVYRRSSEAIMKRLTIEQIAAKAYWIGFQDAIAAIQKSVGGPHERP